MEITRYCFQNLMKLDFLDRFQKSLQKSNFTSIRPVGVEVFYADGQTDKRTVDGLTCLN